MFNLFMYLSGKATGGNRFEVNGGGYGVSMEAESGSIMAGIVAMLCVTVVFVFTIARVIK